MQFIGVMQSLEEEKGFWNVLWDICPHIIKIVLNKNFNKTYVLPFFVKSLAIQIYIERNCINSPC